MAVQGTQIGKVVAATKKLHSDVSLCEVAAMIPYFQGLNAIEQLGRDSYLLAFAPTIDNEILSRYGIDDLSQLDDAINHDTRLLGRVTQDAIDKMRDEWEEECAFAMKVQAKAGALVSLMEARADYLKNPAIRTPEHVSMLQNNYANAQTFIDSFSKDITRIRRAIADGNPLSKRRTNEELLANAQAKLKTAMESRENARVALAAMNAPLAPDSNGILSDRNDVDSNIFFDFIENVISDEAEELEQEAVKRREKYGCIPDYLNAYFNIADEVQSMAASSSPNLHGIRRELIHNVDQYIDVLRNSPADILEIANIFPKLQKDYDEETDMYLSFSENKPSMAGIEEEDSYYRAKYPLGSLRFTRMLETPDKHVVGSRDVKVLSISGKPGIAKTAIVENIANMLDMFFKAYSVPNMTGEDLAGVVAVNNKDEVGRFLPSGMMDAVKKGGILFFDEATAIGSDRAVRNQLVRATQTGLLADGIRINRRSMIVKAQNPVGYGNRNVANPDQVQKTREVDVYLDNEARLMASWVSYIKRDPGIQKNPRLKAAADMVVNFLTQSDNGRKYWSTDTNIKEDVISPNFRSWRSLIDNCGSILIDRYTPHMKKVEDLKKLSSHIVGLDAAEDFATHYSVVSNLPSVDDLLDNMRSDKHKWTLLDSIRVLDMQSELAEVSKLKISEPEDGAEAGRANKMTGKYKLTLNKEADQKMIDMSNEKTREMLKKITGREVSEAELKKSSNYKTVEKNLMSEKELNEAYNDLWGRNSMGSSADMNNSAVMFHFTTQIMGKMDKLFEIARMNKSPVDANVVDDIMKLAMTIPGKDQRLSLVVALMNKVKEPDQWEVLSKYGMYYPATKKSPATVYRYRPKEDKLQKKIQKKDEQTAFPDKMPDGTPISYSASPFIATSTKLLSSLSRSYKLANEQFLEDDPYKKSKKRKKKDDDIDPKNEDTGMEK